ncbi:OmcA/MtrC family decaheme c-type cytochrome [Shewanella sp. M16]|uniref:OmcA/MtrC family decaheme c-type cytochrome n=2 Tax=Shewanellaceae TaxID=267890 RepID=UPI00156971B1|nr:OmcA/MtrC family decaheme c-type cytochrome [Shewanella oncorhynchi]MBS0041785.1 OmcA/MtrC family decaheme c-type cytochrome [Shewanella sp. M16]WVI91915.1 OmcA/MtrC family decaheme c-type cytochrome [Shewanella oncorhynchi]
MMKRFNFNTATKAMLGAGLLSLLLAGCGGSDGKDGEDGKPGPVGLDISQATTLKATLEDVKIDNGTVSVDIVLTNANGVPVTGLEQYAQINAIGLGIAKLTPESGKGYKTPQWVSYINSVKAADPARSLANYSYTDGKDSAGNPITKEVKFTPGDAIQANIESSCKTTCLTVVDSGVYRYTFQTNLSTLPAIEGLDLTYDPTLIHRITLELQTDGSKDAKLVNSHIDFLPSDNFRVAKETETRTVVDLEANCIKCHSTNYSDTSSTAKPLALHGGRRIGIANCQVCHTSYSKDPETGSPLDMGAMVHAIHKGTYAMVGYSGTAYDFSGTMAKAAAESGYPQYREGKDVSERVTLPVSIGNCQSCHSTDDKGPVDAASFKHHKGLACASCHMSGFNPVDNSEWLTPPEGQKDRGFVGNYFHYYATPEIDGIPGANLVNVFQNGGCASCHAEQGEEGSAKYHLAKANATKLLRTEYAYKLENGTFDVAKGELTFTVNWHSDVAPHQDPKVKEFWVSLTAFNGTEYTMGPRPSNGTLGRSENRISVNLAKVETNANLTAVPNGSKVTYTLTGIKAVIGTSSVPYKQIVSIGKGFMDGKLLICANSAELDPTMDAAIDCSNTEAPIYEVIVGSNKASFSADASNVTARSIVISEAKCANCHGEKADFSASHALTHAADKPDNSCGTCHSAVPNTAVALADGSCVACHNGAPAHSKKPFERGFDFKVMIHQIHADTRSVRRLTTDAATFPENPANCAACHDKGQLSLATLGNKPAFLASTGEYSPTVAACASCHATTATDSAVIGHFETNGGVYNAAAGTYTPGSETCATCHGEGKSFGVDKVHPVKY